MVEEDPREPLSPTGSGELSGATETPGVVESATAIDPAVRAGEAAAAAAVAAGDSGPPDVPLTDLTAAAFFDVDNTMMVGASIFHFARGLAARKFFTTADLARLRLAAAEVPHRRPGDRILHHHRPRHRAVVRRGPAGRRDHRARRGDLRRADGRPHLGRHPGARPDAPGRRPAGLAGHRHPGRAGPHHRPPARAHRRAGHGGRERRRRTTPGGWSARSCTARRRPTPSARSPSPRAWTCAAARPTPTP